MIVILPHVEGAVVSVAARPGGRRDALVGVRGEALQIAVTASPERGRANEAVAEVLAKVLECRGSEIRLLSGQTHRSKRFLIVGWTPEDLRRRLEPLLALLEPRGKQSDG